MTKRKHWKFNARPLNAVQQAKALTIRRNKAGLELPTKVVVSALARGDELLAKADARLRELSR